MQQKSTLIVFSLNADGFEFDSFSKGSLFVSDICDYIKISRFATLKFLMIISLAKNLMKKLWSIHPDFLISPSTNISVIFQSPTKSS